MLTPILDKTAGVALYEQLYQYIRGEIGNGSLKPGEKMPSRRRLAAHLKISTVTVEAAYAQLEAEGYLKGVPRSGFYVRRFEGAFPGSRPLPAPRRQEKAAETYDYDFKTNTVASNLFPFATWAKLTWETLALNSDTLLNAASAQGSCELRGEIADYLYKYRGIRADPAQIVVGAGSEYLTALLIQLLGRGTVCALENPGYAKAAQIFTANAAETVRVDLDEQGLSVARLRETRASAVHVTPSHQFPSGIVMPIGRRLELLEWANEKEGRIVIEDDYDSEFRFAGQPIPAMQGLDTSDKVVYINAFTKSIAPTLRVGYIVLTPALAEAYARDYGFYSCTVSNFEQYTLSRFMAEGHFERHLGRMRIAYKQRRDAFIGAIGRGGLGNITQIIGADAGLHLLLKVNNGMDETLLVERAKAVGVRVYGLSEYTHGPVPPQSRSTLVIGYSGFETAQLEAAVKRLETAWQV